LRRVRGPTFVADDPLEAPCRSPADVLASLVREEGFDTVLFAQSVLAADIAAGLAARLGAGLNWDLVDLVDSGELVGKRPALADSVWVDAGWAGEPRLALFRSGAFDPVETGGVAEVRPVEVSLEPHSALAELVEPAVVEVSGRSIEDADVVVAGGRGWAPDGFRAVEELADALGGAVAATRAVVDAGWYRTPRRSGRPGRPSPEALRRGRDLGRVHTRSGCRARARSSRSTRIRTRRSSTTPTSASSVT
jgi:electron transfer flavoprotein alpha subunit